MTSLGTSPQALAEGRFEPLPTRGMEVLTAASVVLALATLALIVT